MSSPLDLFALGSVVELHDLVSASHHNGRRGVVLKVCGSKNERLSVQLEKVSGSETPAPLAVKLSNVRVVPDGDVSRALLRLSSFAIIDRMGAVQDQRDMGILCPSCFEQEHEALIKLQQQNLDKLTTQEFDEPPPTDICQAAQAGDLPAVLRFIAADAACLEQSLELQDNQDL